MSPSLRDSSPPCHSSHGDPCKQPMGLHRNCILAPHGAERDTPHDRGPSSPRSTKPSTPKNESALNTERPTAFRTASETADCSLTSETKPYDPSLESPRLRTLDALPIPRPTPRTTPHFHPAAGKVTHVTASSVQFSAPNKLYFGWR